MLLELNLGAGVTWQELESWREGLLGKATGEIQLLLETQPETERGEKQYSGFSSLLPPILLQCYSVKMLEVETLGNRNAVSCYRG